MANFTPGQYLSTFINHEKNLQAVRFRSGGGFHLARVALVLEALGSPHQSAPVIHVAGSKGKGSTAVMIAEILRAHGFRVGLYTSPHLYDVRERIRILRPGQISQCYKGANLWKDSISEKDFCVSLKTIRPQLNAGRHHPKFGNLTYFEVLTILAFYYFQKKNLDFVVLETGLGGRLDATNVCSSKVAVITPISLEHTAQLGSTIAKISAEKAAIIKKNIDGLRPLVVIAPQPPVAMKVILQRCREVHAHVSRVDRNFALKKGSTSLSSLLGFHQQVNAATAIAVINVLKSYGISISKKAIRQGLKNVVWPLRFEIVAKKPWVVVDAAHNPASFRCLAKTLDMVFLGLGKQKVTLIFGVSDDKDIQGMLAAMAPRIKNLILTQAHHPRALVWTQDEVKKLSLKCPVHVTTSTADACRLAKTLAQPEDGIVAAGSIFCSAEVRKIFLNP